MFNHSHTVLLVTRQVLARIDLSGRKRLSVKQIWTAQGCDYDNVLPEILRAIKLGNRTPARVTVVCPDFWTDVLSIPTDVMAIASETEINQALALEAEVDSGISAFESLTKAIRIVETGEHNDESRWCVSQVLNQHIREISSTLHGSGARLHSISHPIAASLVQPEGVSSDSLHGLLDSWRGSVTLEYDEIQAFATAWAACLSQTPLNPLLMQVPRESVNVKSQSVALTAAFAILATGGSGLWHWYLQNRLATTQQSIEQFEKQQSQREAMEAELKSTEVSLAQLRKELIKTQSSRLAAERQIQLAGAVHSLHNLRWLVLVNALAESASDNCWVQRLESNSKQTIVHGLALDNAAANGFAGRLEVALEGSGWSTAPAATSLSPRNLTAFKIVLKANLEHEEEPVNSGISLNQDAIDKPFDLAGGITP